MDGKPVTAHLKEEWDDPEAIAAAQQVKAMQSQPGWEYLLEAVRLFERKHVTNQIASPKENIQEYAFAAGHIKGLREVEGIAEGIVKYGAEREAARREKEQVIHG